MPPITVVLPPEAWNIVLNALSMRPYGEVAQVVAMIQQQAVTQQAQAELPHMANGQDHLPS